MAEGLGRLGYPDVHAAKAAAYLEKAKDAHTIAEEQCWIEMAKVEADLARTSVLYEAVKAFKDKRFV